MRFLLYATLLFFFTVAQPGFIYGQEPDRPNILLIMTDDQGFGDLGFYGNRQINTPVLDALARQSIRFNRFNVSPVCAPTRASLMTGRYSLRTGIRDTYNGGAIMASGEVTIAEVLKEAGYTNGIFGKWHLGDNYPSRPMDQGFDESVIHLSGGMGQVGDVTTYFRGDSSYFDPVLWHNGSKVRHRGYCSDIFASRAIEFIEKNHGNPFFCYVAFNAPHTPLQVPDRYQQMYADIDPADQLAEANPFNLTMTEKDKDDARSVYAMVSNIDDNVGRLLATLDSLGIRKNTIVIFLTDNGPQQVRYVGGMNGRKGSVYNGGIRVPFFFSYPAMFEGNREIRENAVPMDVLPTLAELCRVPGPSGTDLDGKSLVPLLRGERVDWPDRPLFFYWTRRYPEPYRNMALKKGAYKLVGQAGYDASTREFELYNTILDPGEEHNLVSVEPEIASSLKNELDSIYRDLINSDHLLHPPHIRLGTRFENPVILNRNDAGGQRAIWNQEEVYGKWNVDPEAGTYNFRFQFIKPVEASGRMYLEAGTQVFQKENPDATGMIEMNQVYLPGKKCELIPFYLVDGRRILPFWVEVERMD